MFVDDERELGNSIIITLANGWFFADDPDCGVQGFDTVNDARRGCARKRVVYDPERYAALNPEQAQAEQHDAPQGWAPCSPDLLKSGVCCESAPRIAGRPGSGVSHYHPAPQQESQVRPVTDERAAFEEACRRASLERGQEINPQSLERRADGSYVEPLIQCGWWGWQARAALAPQPVTGEPVAWMVKKTIGGREQVIELTRHKHVAESMAKACANGTEQLIPLCEADAHSVGEGV